MSMLTPAHFLSSLNYLITYVFVENIIFNIFLPTNTNLSYTHVFMLQLEKIFDVYIENQKALPMFKQVSKVQL